MANSSFARSNKHQGNTMNDAKTKQQVVDKIKTSTNILVTVSNGPSVDALSAALGLTLILNKLVKHTTAIFSGAIPPAITFLDPEKTFEASTDSLRDFIIAIDKEKADHLRYKVEGDVVKIFITPYKTTISQEDLDFSQGDFNVELVLALGVENQAHLDGALEAHGRILHDATVITMSAGEQSSSLGSIDWRDETASSLCEMLVSLTEPLQADTPLIDQEIATALLTGIVAETDRFSNTRTTAKVMTMAAQLMAAGADQQLIASNLQESHEINAAPLVPGPQSEDATVGQSGLPTTDGLAINHEVVAPADTTSTPTTNNQPVLEEPTIQQPVAPPSAAPTSQTTKLADAYAPEPDDNEPISDSPPVVKPLLGGIPPATTPEPSAPDSTTDLGSHSYISDSPTYTAPINASEQPDDGGNVDIFAGIQAPTSSTSPFAPPTIPDAIVLPTDNSAGASQDMKSRDEAARDEALAAAHATLDASQPFSPAPGVTLPLPPPLPDFGALPTTTMSPAYALDPIAQPPERLGDILAPEAAVPAQPTTNDPGQFKIPGQ